MQTTNVLTGSCLVAGLVLCLWPAIPAAGQEPEYIRRELGLVPGSYSTSVHAINDHGVIVGSANFSPEYPPVRAFIWTPLDGYTVLPQPPGMNNYDATAINNAGIIAGDGAGTGPSWRFIDGEYEFVPPPRGTYVNSAGAINASGDIVGTTVHLGGSPWDAYFAAEGDPYELLFNDATARHLNDAGQIVGYIDPFMAYRVTPGEEPLMLGPLGERTIVIPRSINSSGDVAGSAAFPNGNGSVPFLFTDDGGMEGLGFSGAASAADIDDQQQIIGNFNSGNNPMPWIWSSDQGVRWLEDLYEFEFLAHRIIEVKRMNEPGEIIGSGCCFQVIVLTPIHVAADVNRDGVVDTSDLLLVISGWGPCPALPDVCPADTNADSQVDVTDLLHILEHWT